MKHVHKLMLTATAFAGALGGLAWWGTKRAEAKSGVNKAVLNNPPPQDATAPPGVFYSKAIQPKVGQQIQVMLPNGGSEVATVIWVQTKQVDERIGMNPVIVVQEANGGKVYVSPK